MIAALSLPIEKTRKQLFAGGNVLGTFWAMKSN